MNPDARTVTGHQEPYSVLVVYAYHRFPMRPTVRSHLQCFARSPLCRATYINLRYRRLPMSILRQHFDLIVFDTTFAGQRWNRERFRRVAQKALPLRDHPAPKALIPQDDFLNTDLLDEFMHQLGVTHVFSALPETSWPEVYAQAPQHTRFTRVLTGYLDAESLENIRCLAAKHPKRDIDIGYRTAWKFWFGKHGMQRKELAERVASAAKGHRLTTDIDTGQRTESDRLRGGDWFSYLLRCKYVLGTDGGTSILDRDGGIRECSETYVATHPDADFETVKRHCFPDADGRHRLFAISPRHLEACATRTCQILLEGEYNGLLQPGVHYLEIKRDFSNLNEVLKHVQKDDLRQGMAERAYRDIVASGRFSYANFVKQVLHTCLEKRSPGTVPYGQRLLFRPWMDLRDRLSWGTVWFVDRFFNPPH